MCELFAKSSRQPANVNLSLDTFADHGGRTGPHRDGWGIAYYEEGDIRLIKDTHQASSSVWVRFVEEQGTGQRHGDQPHPLRHHGPRRAL